MQVLFGRPLRPQTVTLLNAMTTPPSWARAKLIDECIGELIRGGSWAQLDYLYWLKAHDAQAALLNWKNPSTFTLSATGTPSFTTDVGFTYDGSTNYHDTGYRWETTGINASLNSYHLGGWALDTGQNDSAFIGARRTTGGAAHVETITPRNTVDNFNCRVNDQTALNISNPTDGSGHYIINRTGASAREGFKNGASIGSDTQSSTTGADVTTIIGGVNGTTPFLSACNVAAAHAGGALTSPHVSSMSAAFSKFKNSF